MSGPRRDVLEKLARTRAEARAIIRGTKRLIETPARLVERRSHTLGLPPGELEEGIEPTSAEPARISVIRYDAEALEEYVDVDAARAYELTDARHDDVTWINVEGTHDINCVRSLGNLFGLHPLVQEDLANTTQRPKLEQYPDRLFLVVKMVSQVHESSAKSYEFGRPGHQIEQVSFVLGDGFLISFQEEVGDVFEPIRERLRRHGRSIREQGADYLLYALLDIIIDHYFVTLERIGDVTELFEERVFNNPGQEVQRSLSALRRHVIVLRKAIWPLRDVLSSMLRDDMPEFSDRTKLYLRDATDHLVQAIDVLETLRDVLSGLSDLYLSAISHRMNEVMKVLTVVGTLFIPLSFLTGLYGMNFDNMPELHYPLGYFVLLGVMALITLGTLLYFRRKKWL